MGEPVSEQTRNELGRVKALGAKLREQGVKALYLGDGDHLSTNVALNLAAMVDRFRPELIFVETSAELQKRLDATRGKFVVPGSAFMEAAALDVRAKTFAVDEPVAVKLAPDSLHGFHARVSPETHERIATRIVKHIEEFQHSRGRMPSFAVVFGRDHFGPTHGIDHLVKAKLARDNFPSSKSRTVAIEDEQTQHHGAERFCSWLSGFDARVHLDSASPPGIPDVCNPDFGTRRVIPGSPHR